MAEDDIVSRIEKEMGIEGRRIRITLPASFLSKAIELEDERQERSILMDVSKAIDTDIDEIKMDIGRMFLTLKQLKKFSGKLREHIEKPLRDNIYTLRKRKKILATDATLMEREILKSIDTFDRLSNQKKKLEESPHAIGMLNIVSDFKEEKEKKPKVEKPTEKKPIEVKEEKKEGK